MGIKYKKFRYVSGLEGHIIFAVNQDGQSNADAYLDFQRVRHELGQRGLRPVPITGKYFEQEEIGFIISSLHLLIVLNMAKACNQRSILQIRKDNTAVLLAVDGSILSKQGHCWRVSPAIGDKFPNTTTHVETQSVWVCD